MSTTLGLSDEITRKKKKEREAQSFAQSTLVNRRLQKIERECRSIGSILDNRNLHPLAEITPVGKHQMETEKQEIRRNTFLNSGNIETENDDDDKFSAIAGDFKEEEMIWKSKSRGAAFTIKRRFEDPSLHKFRNSMNSWQKKKFSKKSRDAVITIAQTCREDLTRLKKEMDDRGIFHPEANAQRAHCIYLLKLYKELNAETVEDPILRKLKEEERGTGPVKKDEDLDRRKMKTASSFVQKLSRKLNDTLEKCQAAEASLAPRSRGRERSVLSRQSSQASLQSNVGEMLPKKAVTEALTSPSPPARAPSLSKLLEAGSFRASGLLRRQSSLSRPGSPEAIAAAIMSKKLDLKEKEKTLSKLSQASDTDPSHILVDEAERLHQAPRAQPKKVEAKVDFLGHEATSWMLSAVREDQVSQAAGAYSFSMPSWRAIPTIADPADKEGEEFEEDAGVQAAVFEFIQNNSITGKVTQALHNHDFMFASSPNSISVTHRDKPTMSAGPPQYPMEVMSFEKFREAFKEYEERDPTKVPAPLSEVPVRADFTHLEIDQTGPPSGLSPSSGPHPQHGHLSPLNPATGGGGPAQGPVLVPGPAAPINAVRVLAKVDDKFGDYLKMNKIGGKAKRHHASLPSNLTSKHRSSNHPGEGEDVLGRPRLVPLLGKKAITLRGRGDPDRLFKKGNQGFQNKFSKTVPSSPPKSRGATREAKCRSPLTGAASAEEHPDHLAAADGTVPADIYLENEPRGPILTYADADSEGITHTQTPFDKKSPSLISRVNTGQSLYTPGSGGWPNWRLPTRDAESPSVFSVDRNTGSGTRSPPVGSRVHTGAHTAMSSHSRRSRHKRKSAEERAADGDSVTVQQKLTGIWTLLETSANAKIVFMRKYSNSTRAADLIQAMDWWGQAAALVALRVGIQKLSIEKQQGFITGSLSYATFKRYLMSAVSPVLTSTSPELAPQNRLDYEETRAPDRAPPVLPLSVSVIRTTKKSLKKVFMKLAHSHESGGESDLFVEEEFIARLLLHIVRKIDRKLLATIRQTREVLGDFIGYGDTTVREWLMSLATAMEHVSDMWTDASKTADVVGEDNSLHEGDGNAATSAAPTHRKHSALLHLTGEDFDGEGSESGDD